MRSALVLVACGAFFLQPALAFNTYDVTVKMSRADTPQRDAQSDGYACWKRTTPMRTLEGKYGKPYFLSWDIRRPAQVASFVHCMEDRGYRLDPNGHQVARFHHVSAT